MSQHRQNYTMSIPRSVIDYFPAQQLLKILTKNNSPSPGNSTTRDDGERGNIQLNPVLQPYHHHYQERKPSYSTMEVRHQEYPTDSESKYDENLMRHHRKLEKEKK